MKRRTGVTVTLREFCTSSLSKKIQGIGGTIARQACNLFVFRRFGHGHDWANWIHAESQFLHRAPVEILDHVQELGRRNFDGPKRRI
jgi:hypothetical protein